MGAVVEKLAWEDMEGARVIMRRLMWSLNEESGGIGWGAPEAMAEIMARHLELAREYSHMLISYMDYEGNFLGVWSCSVVCSGVCTLDPRQAADAGWRCRSSSSEASRSTDVER